MKDIAGKSGKERWPGKSGADREKRQDSRVEERVFATNCLHPVIGSSIRGANVINSIVNSGDREILYELSKNL